MLRLVALIRKELWHFKLLCTLLANSDQFCMKDKHCIVQLENGRIYLSGPGIKWSDFPRRRGNSYSYFIYIPSDVQYM